VSEGDVKTANASGGTIIAFNASTDAIARELAERDHISILSFSIIYELSEKVATLLKERVPEIETEKELGRAKVLKAFSSSAKKQVLGARHISGVLTLGDRIKLMRGEEELSRGSITTLQQARSPVTEIKVEGDFGIEIETRESATYGDDIVAFVIAKI
jgi:translation initiation factor IF-2